MKRLTFKHVEEKKAKKKQWVVSGLLLFIMFFSIIGYAFESVLINQSSGGPTGLSKIKYNGFEFSNQNGFWVLNFSGNDLIFTNTPYQTNETEFSLIKISDYAGKKLYIYSEDGLAESEIRANMFNFVDGIESACPENSNCSDFPAKTCENNFIILRNSDINEIKRDRNCIFISGNDLIDSADEFLFRTFGIKQ